MTSRRWLEFGFLRIVLAACAALWVFLKVASEMGEGETGAIDSEILLALHSSTQPDPRWLVQLARDITSLGSSVVLGLVVVVTCAFLLLVRKYRTAIFLFAATSIAEIASFALKMYFSRPRPDLIPHDIYVSDASFPSGHAMLSTTVYLTLGAILARLVPIVQLKLYIMSVATVLAGLVGLSRLYLGVHWPTDVVAGWAIGAAWAAAAWGIAQTLQIGKDLDRP